MASRIGIELSPVACRIVEIETGLFGRIPVETRVKSFAILPSGSSEMAAKLASFDRHDVAVVAWGAPSAHRQVMVTQGPYNSMRAEAIASAGEAGTDVDGMLADIAPGGPVEGGRRTVLLALAGSREMSAAVQPILQAGARIRVLATPADALASLARLRRSITAPDLIETYVALEERAICIALVRNGLLLADRELAWGFLEDSADGQVRPREDLAARLADDLTEFLSTVGAAPGSMAQVSICGGMPELRSMTVPLMERLDVEVEPLDALFGIDTAHLPDAEEFRERSQELRLAWAVAASKPAAINLLRERQNQGRRAIVWPAAVAAGVALGLGVGWRVQRSEWWRRKPPTGVVLTDTVARTQPKGDGTPREHAEPRPAAPIPPPQPLTSLSSAPSEPSRTGGAIGADKVPSLPPPLVTPPPAVPARTVTPASAAQTPTVPSPPTAPTRTGAPPPAAPAPTMKPPLASSALSPTASAATGSPARSTKPAEQPQPTPLLPSRSSAPPLPSAGATPARSAESAPRPSAPAPAAVATPRSSAPARAADPSPRPNPSAGVTEPAARSTPSPARQPAPIAPGRPIAPPTLPSTPAASAKVTAPPTPPPGPLPSVPFAVPPPSRQTAAASPPARAPARPPEPEPLPLDAALESILYSPDRKLAIVDGRIVEVGDVVKGARIIDITPTAVLLRDAQGRLRRLTLGSR